MENITYENTNYFNFNGLSTKAKVLRIYDGDTIIIGFIFNDSCIKYKCRLNGIDSPEIKAQDEKMKHDAYIARNKLIKLITNIEINGDNMDSYQKMNKRMIENTKIIDVKLNDFDKYGRILIDIIIDNEIINNKLVDNIYWNKYDGKTKLEFN